MIKQPSAANTDGYFPSGEESEAWIKRRYTVHGLFVPALTIFLVFFIIPMVTSLFFSLTVWDLKSFTF